jgi:hypothetical protein
MAAPCTSIADGRLADLLEEIFVRLPTPADLVRASVAFHHIDSVRELVSDRSFLRRFRKEHSRIYIGFLDGQDFLLARPPHTSAAIASAVAGAADFSFSFLPRPARYCGTFPKPGCWTLRDIRDGRVLLDRLPTHSLVFSEVVVCDPLHRRYRLLPPIPDDLAALVKNPPNVSFESCYEVILLPPGKEVDEETDGYDTSFRVLWMAQCEMKPVAFVYFSNTEQWQAIASQDWGDLLGCVTTVSLKYSLFSRCCYAHGCLYWSMCPPIYGLENYPREVMLVLDTMRLEFSLADLPPGRKWREYVFHVVEAGEGQLGLLTLEDGGRGTSELHYTVRENTDGSSNEWWLEKIIPLDDSGYGYHIITANERYLLLRKSTSNMPFRHDEGLSLDLKTFRLEKVCKIGFVSTSFIYTSFPPSLSSSTV